MLKTLTSLAIPKSLNLIVNEASSVLDTRKFLAATSLINEQLKSDTCAHIQLSQYVAVLDSTELLCLQSKITSMQLTCLIFAPS